MPNLLRYVIGFFLVLFCCCAARAQSAMLYFGTQSAEPGAGFSMSHFDCATGKLLPPKLMTAADGPSYFTFTADGKRLYSTVYRGAGGVSAYRIDPRSGAMSLINSIAGGNAGTSYISLDKTEKFALAANYNTGHVAVFPVRTDGGLAEASADIYHEGSSINPKRQAHTYPHCIITDPTNRFAFSTDLGLDQVFTYNLDLVHGQLVPSEAPFTTVTPGAGPRHIRFHPNGKWVYLVCEMGNIINAYDWDSQTGRLTLGQTISTLPESFTGEDTAAELVIHPNGKFLYTTNRGNDSIAEFSINQETGALTNLGWISSGGKTPRNMVIDPTGNWIICTNQQSDNAVVFKIDPESGKLSKHGPAVSVPAPCGLAFAPMGK